MVYHCCILALKGSYEKLERSLPKLEDLQGAAQGLMRIQDMYALQVEGMVKGYFQQISNGTRVDIYKPSVCIPLSGDDCFLVGKAHCKIFSCKITVKHRQQGFQLFTIIFSVYAVF